MKIEVKDGTIEITSKDKKVHVKTIDEETGDATMDCKLTGVIKFALSPDMKLTVQDCDDKKQDTDTTQEKTNKRTVSKEFPDYFSEKWRENWWNVWSEAAKRVRTEVEEQNLQAKDTGKKQDPSPQTELPGGKGERILRIRGENQKRL